MIATDDIPSLTLKVLQDIQTELVGVNARLDTLTTKADTLNGRFDQFLSFAGRDVSDLETRMSRVEQRLGLAE